MSNPFEAPTGDVDSQNTLVNLNPFEPSTETNPFEEPSVQVQAPPVDTQMGLAENALRKQGARWRDLLAGHIQANTADLQQLKPDEQGDTNLPVQTGLMTPKIAREAVKFIKGIGFGEQEGIGDVQDIKETYKEHGMGLETVGAVAGAGFSTTVESIPDWVGLATSLPNYIMARAGEMSEERAKNKGLEHVTGREVMESIPGAVGSALLERIGMKKSTGIGDETFQKVARELFEEGYKIAAKRYGKEVLKGAGYEGLTELLQEGVVEYITEKAFTNAELNVMEAGERGFWGALLGTVGGGQTKAVTLGAQVGLERLGKRGTGIAVEDDDLPTLEEFEDKKKEPTIDEGKVVVAPEEGLPTIEDPVQQALDEEVIQNLEDADALEETLFGQAETNPFIPVDLYVESPTDSPVIAAAKAEANIRRMNARADTLAAAPEVASPFEKGKATEAIDNVSHTWVSVWNKQWVKVTRGIDTKSKRELGWKPLEEIPNQSVIDYYNDLQTRLPATFDQLPKGVLKRVNSYLQKGLPLEVIDSYVQSLPHTGKGKAFLKTWNALLAQDQETFTSGRDNSIRFKTKQKVFGMGFDHAPGMELNEWNQFTHGVLSNRHLSSEEKVATIREAIRPSRMLQRQLMKTIEQYVDTYMPGNQIGLVDNTYLKKERDYDHHTWGHMQGGANEIQYLYVNTDKFENEVDPKYRAIAMKHTLDHEFGHMIAREYLDATPEQYVEKHGLTKDEYVKVLRLIKDGYRTWAAERIRLRDQETYRDFKVSKAGTTAYGISDKRSDKEDIHSLPLIPRRDETFLYDISMKEYIADNIGLYLSADPKTLTKVGKFWRGLIDKLKETFLGIQLQGNPKPSEGISYLMEILRAKVYKEKMEGLISKTPIKAITSTNESTVGKGVDAIGKAVGIERSAQPTGTPGETISNKDLQPFKDSLVKYNKFMEESLTLVQMGQENAEVPGVRGYVQGIRNWWADKIELSSMANERARELMRLDKSERHNLSHFAHELTLLSDEAKKRLGPQDQAFADLLKKYPLTERAQQMFEATSKDFDLVINQVYGVLKEDAKSKFTHIGHPQERAFKIAKLVEHLNNEQRDLLNRNYWPLSRFGRYWVQIRAPKPGVYGGKTYKQGEVMWFETFETEHAAIAKRKGAEAKYGQGVAQDGKMSDTQMSFHGMPPALVDKLKAMIIGTDKTTAEMSPEEKAAAEALLGEKLDRFDSLMHSLAPGQSFAHRLQRRKGTPGYSFDAIRGYASYMQSAANHVARIKHYRHLQESIKQTEQYKLEVKSAGDVQRLVDYMKRHYESAMNPGEEWANLRAVGFLWYLAAVPKSAFVNLTQVPVVSYAYLSQRHGYAKATKELGRAMVQLPKVWKQGKKLEPELAIALEEGVKAGFLSESIATELAGIANGSNLQRLLPGTFLKSEKAARAVRTTAAAGAWMFQKAEQINRYVTFTAAFRLKRDQLLKEMGLKKIDDVVDEDTRAKLYKTAWENARHSIDTTQGEYARWNRPQIARGRTSVIFLFKMYMQHMMYMLARDPGRWRFMLHQLVVAGALGFPFADDIDDLLIKPSMLLWRKYTNKDEPVKNAKLEARKWLKDIGVDPDLLLYGASHELFGISNVSGSLSLGNIIPGTEMVGSALTGQGAEDPNRAFVQASEEALGAFWAIPFRFYRALNSNSPDEWRNWEKTAPKAFANLSAAIRWGSRGYASTYSGAPIENLPFDYTDPRHLAELVGKAMGFQPTRVSDEMQMRWEIRETGKFWETRRRMLMQESNWSRYKGSRESEADVDKAVDEYNRTLPWQDLWLSEKDRATSFKRFRRSMEDDQYGDPKNRKFSEITEEYQEAYSEEPVK